MNQEYYLIKEAAAKVGVESHVLRYWEEELKMDIHRNAMGHRYYTEKDIQVLSKVKELKEKGLQLKAIRDYLEKRRQQLISGEESKELVSVKLQTISGEDKMEQFQQIMNRVLSNAIRENNELIGQAAGEHAANAVVTQMAGMTKEQEERAEERYRKLDQTLREIQQARAEAAAANMRPVDRRKQKRLKRKNNQISENAAAKEEKPL
jgi:DNA-binding transcriptional MerR regulator